MKRITILLLAAGLAACAGPRIKTTEGVAVELTATPFFAQEDHQCGPAALATVLVASGVAVEPADIVPKVYLPQRKGSLQTELIAATRDYGRVPYRLDAELSALQAEVEAGHPVLVLQNLGVSFWPQWHYAVVIGFDPERNEVLLRSGRESRARMSAARFLLSWRLGGYWALVTPAPDNIPATAQPSRWIETVSAFEALGKAPMAASAYAAATQRWPQQALVWFAHANAVYAQGDLTGATRALRRALVLDPQDAAARNNLAQVLGEQGCRAQAEAEIAQALADASPAQRAEIEATQIQLRAMPDKPGLVCPY